MAEELEVLWKKLSFTEEEDEGIEIDSNSPKMAKEVGKNCALMKSMAHKSINLDTLRKNMRMVWKPNKGVQISEVEEDLFLVEFSDGKDKKKVLDMCPWNFEKQLVLIQEFDGELTPKDIEIKWAPFWIQIFNLPLKCMTKEIGRTIGSKLGEVMEVDVSDSGVHWGRCLRVRVRIDVTKRLVRGKKITIEGGEGRWVQLKYERLPNFCYRCGLLNHTLKDCSESSERIAVGGDEELQYGAWLRGEFVRRSSHDPNSYGSEKSVGTRSWEANAVAEKGSEVLQARGSTKKDGKEHVPNLTTLEKSPLTWSETGVIALKQQPEFLHKNSLVRELVRKQGEKEAILSEEVMDQGKSQAGLKEKTCGETATDHKDTPIFKPVMAPSHNTNNVEDGPLSLRAESGLIAMSYDMDNGWTSEPLGPRSRHWKRLACEVKANSSPNEKSPTWLKRKGPISLEKLDSKANKQKRRKGGKQSNQTWDEKIPKDGGEAMVAAQHRRAK